MLDRGAVSSPRPANERLGGSLFAQWKQRRQERFSRAHARVELLRREAAQLAERTDVRARRPSPAEIAQGFADFAAAKAKARHVAAGAAPAVVDGLLANYQRQLAPQGSTAETAVNAAIVASGVSRTDADIHRSTFVGLVRKFARPDERVVGVYLKSPILPASKVKVTGMVVILTHGFAVKSGSKQFRVERAGATVGVRLDPRDGDGSVTAFAQLGDLRLDEISHGSLGLDDLGSFNSWNISLPPLYAALRTQRDAIETAKTTVSGSRERQTASPRPRPVLIRTWRDAEFVAAEWMKFWGYTNVAATAVGADGGVDVRSNEAVAQVKAETIPTGRPKIQQHHGVAVAEGKTAIFFALAGFTPGARAYAEENGILLFTFDLQGEPEPVNPSAHALMAERR